MAGVKLGDRVIAFGTRDTAFIAALAAKAGLTGRAAVVEEDQTRATEAAAGIEREGALAEMTRAPWGMLPFDDASFDVAVMKDLLMTLPRDARANAVAEAHRVLRPGGRLLVIEPAPRGGFGAVSGRQRAVDDYRGPLETLSVTGASRDVTGA